MTKRRRVIITKKVLAAALSLNAARGGKARAKKLTPERLREIGRMGGIASAKVRWGKGKAVKARPR